MNAERSSRYRKLFETAQEGIVVTTPAGEVLDCNPAFCQLTGYAREELLGRMVSTLYAEPTHEKITRVLQERRHVGDLEITIRRKNGEERICRVSAVLWTGPEGEVEGVQSFVRDVTEERQAKEALEESERRFRTLAEGAPVGISMLQEEGFVYVNPTFCQIFDYESEELLGKVPKELYHPEDWPEVRRWIQEVLAENRDAFQAETRARTKSGETRSVEIYAGRVTYRDAPALIWGVIDVTERKQMQREILRVQEEERRRLGQDLHDGVAAQLSGVVMLLTALKVRAENEYPDFFPGVQKVIEIVRESTEDLRRISRGLNPAIVQGGGLLSALERLVENTSRCTLHVEKVEGLDDLEDEEERQLYWIAQEAVANALKYAESSRIEIRLRRKDRGYVLEVEDDGSGFDLSAIEEEKSLGFRSMRHRAEVLGAVLDIESTPGEGTLVRCFLPV